MTLQTKSAATLLMVGVIIFSAISLRLISPPAVVPSTQGDEKFSAQRALLFLSVIAQEPHAAGTPAHAKVRDYIYTYCERMGLETQLLQQTGINVYSNSVRAGAVQNILARMKGTEPGKAILVMSHYDSQPNTPGASDDGAGVAAMMEAIRMFKNLPPLKNDVLFLFTDIEESGLFGAESFVSEYKNLDEIGLIMNFEARGNAGVSFTFEVSKQNGWMMREFSKAVKNPFANSFAYEVYKVMPNDTDFSKFRNSGITGFNSAFIDGYSYYHSMADRVENIDVRSLQHHGDILTQSLQHFGNTSLANTKGEDVIFFNPIGSVLWLYPLSWDVPLMIFTFILWLVLATIGYKKDRIKIGSMFIGSGLFIGFFVMSCLLVWALAKLIIILYPHYTNFYSNNFYNATDYFWAIAGAVLFCFMLLFKKVSSGKSHESVMLGSVFMMLLMMVGVKTIFNTGAYLLYYPLLALMLVQLFLFVKNVKREEKPFVYGAAHLLSMVPAIFLWMPMAYVIFIAFSLILPFGAVVLLSFCAPFLLSTLGMSQVFGKRIIFIYPAVLFLFGFLQGHRHSGYDRRHPLQSELMYAVDMDSRAAFWISTQKKLDDWNGNYISSTAKESFDEFYPGNGNAFWKSNAPFQETSHGKIEALKDSLAGGKRFLKLIAFADSAAHGVKLSFANEVELHAVNERTIQDGKKIKSLQFMAPPAHGIILELMTETVPLQISVIEQRMGLPSSLLVKPLPEDYIYAPNYFSNTTHLKYQSKI